MKGVLERKYIFADKCSHNQFLVDERMNFVECGLCHEKLNPMWVLGQLCNREARANREVEGLQKCAAAAEEKNRCKCEKCGQMTRIVK